MKKRHQKKAASNAIHPIVLSRKTEPLLATFDVAQTTANNRKHWAAADGLSARAAISPGVRRVIRMRSRYEAANNSWYSGILRTAVNHIVGKGPRLQMLTGDPAANQRVEQDWSTWAKKINFAAKLRTMVEAYWRDGESYAMKCHRPKNWPYTLDIRIFETEQCATPFDHSYIISDGFVDDGIRFDGSTNEIEYYILDHHPGSTTYSATLGGQWYSAQDVVHLFRTDRPGQTRGLPRATPSLQMLPIMRRQELATLYTAESAANFGMFMKSTAAAITPKNSPADFAEMEMAVNMLTILPAGWDIGQVEAKQPGPQYEMFQRQALTSFARSTCMPYPLAAGTAGQSNFSSYKGDIRNVWKPEVITEQDHIESVACELFFQWYCEDAIYRTGVLTGLPPIDQIPHRWIWPPLPDIDPIDTANTDAVRVATGQATLTQIHSEKGTDWETEKCKGASDFGVTVQQYEAGVFFKTFGISIADAMATTAATQPAQAQAQPAMPQGEYTQLGQRAFTNNLKRIRSTLESLINGDMSRVLAEQTLASIGLSPDRIPALIQDALDGRVDDPQLVGAV